LYGWSFKETRVGLACGNALFDGDYRTSWPHFGAVQQMALSATLSSLKGGIESLPRGVVLPPVDDSRLPHAMVFDVIQKSRELAAALKDPEYPQASVFTRSYDVVAPLPSSKGLASHSNVLMAKAVSKAFTDSGGDAGPPIEHLVLRRSPLPVKSTKLQRDVRNRRDAARLIHFDTMSLNPQCKSAIRGAKILLWDDVMTWGNTSDAARNLLLLGGAAQVDTITAFNTGQMARAHEYVVAEGMDPEQVLFAESPNKESFSLKSVQFLEKVVIDWNEEAHSIKQWHDDLGEWVSQGWPHFVPNDVPF
jgi:hypothetical protein